MFSRKRTIPVAAATALSLALLAGCKTSAKKVEPAPPAVVSVPQTNTTPPPPQVTQPMLPPDSGDNMTSNILAWDAIEKEYRVQPGDKRAPFTFNLTNVSPQSVTIYDTSTTCDCTVAKLPAKPWTIPSGGSGQMQASMNLSNKTHTATIDVIVFTSQGNRRLKVKALFPDS